MLGWRRGRKRARTARVTACNLASGSSLAEITGSFFPRSTQPPLPPPSLPPSPPLYPLAAQSCDFVSKTLLSRQRCRGRYTRIEDHRGEPDFLMLAASIRASFHGGRISRRDIGNNEFIKAGRAEIGNTVSLAQVAVNSRLVFLSLFQSHRDIPGVAIFLVESTEGRKKRKISFIYIYIYMYAYGEVVDRTVVRTCALACPLLDRSTSYYYVKLSPSLSAGTGKQITTAREISVHGTRQSPILATTYLSACHRFVITVDTVFSIPAAANTCRCSRAIPWAVHAGRFSRQASRNLRSRSRATKNRK